MRGQTASEPFSARTLSRMLPERRKPHANDRHGYCLENLPHALKDLPQWGIWRREYQNGKIQNVPFDAKTGNNLSVSDPTTWSPYEVALDVYLRGFRGQWDGISFVLKAQGGIVGLDDDDCIDENGELTPEAAEIVRVWGSYLEYSPSRRGLRGFAYGTLPEGRRKVGNLEIYDRAKALTVTGWHINGMPKTLEERTEAIHEIHRFFFATTKKQHAKGTFNPEDYDPLADDEVLELALRAKNGVRVQALMDGDFSGYASPSEADLAACNFLAFYCGPDSHEQIDRIFRAHFAGFRPHKWDKRHYATGETYGQHTVKVALEGRTEFYTRPWRSPQHEPLTDEEENAIYIAQELELDEEEAVPDTESGAATEPCTATEEQADTEDSARGYEDKAEDKAEPKTEAKPTTPYPCPDILWQGIFKSVADKLGLWTWEVWQGTFGALCAGAQRNLHCYYYSDHVYGNSFSLLVNPTGAGKNIVVNIARTLLGETYKVRTGLNSGPALVPMLTDDSLKAKEGRLEVRGVPVLLRCSEWSRIAQMAGIEHATLQEDLNDLFMRHYPWSQSRSHKSSTGGDIVITNPTLTVVGTTTRTLFHQALTDKALGSGTINRYLIVPGTATFQAYTGKSYRADESVLGLIDHLKTHTFGLGQEIKALYSPEAWEAFLAFQDTFILPLHNDPSTSEALKRLHLHLQHIAALYAWQTQSPCIELDHFEAAKAVIETSHKFVTELLEERAKTFEPTRIQEVEAAMEQQVIAKLKKSPGLTRREFARQMSKDKGGYTAWGKTIDALIKAGAITTKRKGQREELYVLPGF